MEPDNKFDDIKGRVKEAAGDLTDNSDMKREGTVERATAAIKDTVDTVADKIKDILHHD